MTRDEITLIGAGLAGSLLAVFLGKRGVPVRVFEKRADLRAVEISAGRSINLALASRGIHALEQAGVMSEVAPLLIPMRGRMIHEEDGSLHLLPYGNKPHEVIHSVSRSGLTALLMDAAEATGHVEILFDHSCRAIDLHRQTAELDVRSVDAVETTDWRILIGTDGSASAVRSTILDAAGGTIDVEPLGHSYKELSIPPGRNGSFRIEQHALHIWPRGEFMLIALPNLDGSFTVTLFLPNEGDESFASLDDSGSLQRFFERRFPDALPLLTNLEEEFFGNPTGHLETVRCWPWSFGSSLILGDAAHAIVPFHGQGMNAAFEDCEELDGHLDRFRGNWSKRFARVAERRKPNTEAIADMAIENYVEMRSTVRDPKFALRKELGFRLEEMFPDRFIPRYSMVMFHRVPYAEAQRRGAIQSGILDELTREAERIDQVDFELARRLIARRLPER